MIEIVIYIWRENVSFDVVQIGLTRYWQLQFCCWQQAISKLALASWHAKTSKICNLQSTFSPQAQCEPLS